MSPRGPPIWEVPSPSASQGTRQLPIKAAAADRGLVLDSACRSSDNDSSSSSSSCCCCCCCRWPSLFLPSPPPVFLLNDIRRRNREGHEEESRLEPQGPRSPARGRGPSHGPTRKLPPSYMLVFQWLSGICLVRKNRKNNAVRLSKGETAANSSRRPCLRASGLVRAARAAAASSLDAAASAAAMRGRVLGGVPTASERSSSSTVLHFVCLLLPLPTPCCEAARRLVTAAAAIAATAAIEAGTSATAAATAVATATLARAAAVAAALTAAATAAAARERERMWWFPLTSLRRSRRLEPQKTRSASVGGPSPPLQRGTSCEVVVRSPWGSSAAACHGSSSPAASAGGPPFPVAGCMRGPPHCYSEVLPSAAAAELLTEINSFLAALPASLTSSTLVPGPVRTQTSGHLFVGTLAHALHEELLLSLRIRVVVTAAWPYGAWPSKQKQLYHKMGITHYVHPLLDDPSQTLGFDRLPLGAMRDALLRGHNVFVHCEKGISRSVAVCLAYLIVFEGHSLRSAYHTLRQGRPIARPNIGFIQQLLDLEKRVARGGGPLSRMGRSPSLPRMAPVPSRGPAPPPSRTLRGPSLPRDVVRGSPPYAGGGGGAPPFAAPGTGASQGHSFVNVRQQTCLQGQGGALPVASLTGLDQQRPREDAAAAAAARAPLLHACEQGTAAGRFPPLTQPVVAFGPPAVSLAADSRSGLAAAADRAGREDDTQRPPPYADSNPKGPPAASCSSSSTSNGSMKGCSFGLDSNCSSSKDISSSVNTSSGSLFSTSSGSTNSSSGSNSSNGGSSSSSNRGSAVLSAAAGGAASSQANDAWGFSSPASGPLPLVVSASWHSSVPPSRPSGGDPLLPLARPVRYATAVLGGPPESGFLTSDHLKLGEGGAPSATAAVIPFSWGGSFAASPAGALWMP
ncbi:hypothetical protein Efla_002285 [Eimeria flavescens]